MNKVKVSKKIADNIESMERNKSDLPNETPKLIRTKKVIIEKGDEEDEEDEEEKEKQNKSLILREKKLKALVNARLKRKENSDKRIAVKNHEKDIMQSLLVKEVSEKYTNSREFKLMENKLKKDIINQLKQKKLNQLKEKYGYKSDEEESEEEEEEQKPIPKRKVVKETVFEVYNKYGF